MGGASAGGKGSCCPLCSGVSKNFEKGEDNLSAASSFIANAHNEIYAFYTEKNRLFDKNMSQ